MKKNRVWIWLLTVGVGTGLHFLHDLWPVPLTAVFAPVNESVWEHLKLLFWPMLLGGIFLEKTSPVPEKTRAGVRGAVLAMPVWLTGAFYLLHCGFSVTELWVDLTLYFLTMAAGFLFVGRIEKRQLPKWAPAALFLCVLFYGGALIWFTTFPPPLPIFLPPA